jgi:hypothetical protein
VRSRVLNWRSQNGRVLPQLPRQPRPEPADALAGLDVVGPRRVEGLLWKHLGSDRWHQVGASRGCPTLGRPSFCRETGLGGTGPKQFRAPYKQGVACSSHAPPI